MSVDSANAVLGVISEKVITPIVDSIARQFGYLFHHNRNIRNLVKRVAQLENARNDAERILQARERNNEEKTDSCTAWLNDVEDKTRTAKEVAESSDKMKGKCLNLKGRYSVCRKSTKLAKDIMKLQGQASKIITINPTPPAGMLPGSLSNDGSKGYKSRIKAMDEIMAALEDETVSIIGICGLGGVGKNLRMLSLDGALIHEDAMSMIKELNRLEFLSFFGSKIVLFPYQIAQLSNLKLLDLRSFDMSLTSLEGSGPIPSNFLSQLNKLEELYTGRYHFSATPNSGEEGIHGKSHGYVTELDSLSNLTTLHVLFDNPMELLDLQHFRFEKLKGFHFSSTKCDPLFDSFFNPFDSLRLSIVKRSLILKKIGMKWVLGAKMEFIVRSTLDLRLEEIDWTDLLLIDKFVALESLKMTKWKRLKYIIHDDATRLGEGTSSCNALLFPKLKYLKVLATSKLQGFCSFDDGRQQPLLNLSVMLPSMEELEVADMELRQITRVGILDVPEFAASEWLQNLKKINVRKCDSLRVVFDFEGQHLGENVHIVALGKLQEIKLRSLLKLSQIFCCRMQDISVPQLQVIDVQGCDALVNVIDSGFRKLLQNLKQVRLRTCKSVKAAFDFEGLVVASEDAGAILGELEELRLWHLRNLEHVFKMFPRGTPGFQNLRLLDVRTCRGLSYLLSSSVATMLVNLESLIISDCKIIKEVIKMDEDFAGNKIVLPSLCWVKLVRLKNLLSFCSSNLQGFELPSLEQVLIVECPLMKNFCSGPLTTEILQEVKFAHSRCIDGKPQGVKRGVSFYGVYDFDFDVDGDGNDIDIFDDEPFWKNDLNETVQYYNRRVNQMDGPQDEGSDRDESVQSNNEGDLSEPSEASLSPLVVSSSLLVANDNNERVDSSSNPELRNGADAPSVVSSPSKPDEVTFDSSSSPEEWKKSRVLIQGVYIEAKMATSFEEILADNPDFLSGLRLKNARMKTELVESAIRSFQILRHSTLSTISPEQLAYIKDSLDDMEASGVDITWVNRDYQRAMKEKRVVMASAELVRLETEHAEAEDGLKLARTKLETLTAQRDALKAEYEGLMQELEDEKKLHDKIFGDGFDDDTSLE